MISVVYTVDNNCTSFPCMGTKLNHDRKFELSSPAGPFKFVAVDSLGPLPHTKASNRFVVIMTKRCTKQARAVAKTKIALTQVSNIFSNHWLSPCGIPDTVHSADGQQFVRNFFKFLCSYLGTTKLATTAFHPLTNGQVNRYKKSPITQKQLCIADIQKKRIFIASASLCLQLPSLLFYRRDNLLAGTFASSARTDHN